MTLPYVDIKWRQGKDGQPEPTVSSFREGRCLYLKDLRELLEDKIKRIGESESIFFNDLGGPAHAEGMKVAYEDMLAFVKKLDSDEK